MIMMATKKKSDRESLDFERDFYGDSDESGNNCDKGGAPTPQQPNRLAQENRIQNLNSSLIAKPGQQGGTLQPYNRPILSVHNGQSSISPVTPRSSVITNTGGTLRHRTSASQYGSSLALQNPRPYPIINQKAQGILEKMVDYLIGDGPQNRYALICKECFAHNGMARQEEFEYATFRCAFCNSLNPSRKSRPVAPKLPTTVVSPLNNRISALSARNSDSASSSDSSDDSDAPRRLANVTLPQATEEKIEEPAVVNDNTDVNMNGITAVSEESETKQQTETKQQSEPHSDEEKLNADKVINEKIEQIEEVEGAIKESETT